MIFQVYRLDSFFTFMWPSDTKFDLDAGNFPYAMGRSDGTPLKSILKEKPLLLEYTVQKTMTWIVNLEVLASFPEDWADL